MSEKPYKVIIEGQNGAGNQVFEAETPEELQTKFQEAQTHATAKIREQAQENTTLREQLAALQSNIEPVAPNGNGAANNQQLFQTLYNSPVQFIKDGLSQAIGMPFDDFIKDYTKTVRPGAEMAKINAVNAAFVQKHPELLSVSPEDDLHNANAMRKIIADNGWEYNERNLHAAFALAKNDGYLKIAPAAAGAEVVMQPVPTTVTRPAAAANTSESEEHFLRTAPTEKVREFLEKKYASARS